MILKRLTVLNFGPFAFPTELKVHPEVTILTGHNDTGKSYLLRLVHLIYSTNRAAEEDDINTDHRHEMTGPWDQDEEVYCLATFIATKDHRMYLAPGRRGLKPGDEIDFRIPLTPQRRDIILQGFRRPGTDDQPNAGNVKQMPGVLSLPLKAEVRPIIDLIPIAY